MSGDFSRRLTLLRKERGISQKKAAESLGISQALLSHYEKGIRGCGLDFVLKTADFFGVSCDYLLGKSNEATGVLLYPTDIPDFETQKDNTSKLGLMPLLNRKLLINSILIMFDVMEKSGNRDLVSAVSNILMLNVYKIFRELHGSYDSNNKEMFRLPAEMYSMLSMSKIYENEAQLRVLLSGISSDYCSDPCNTASFKMSTKSLSEDYPSICSSLLNLIANCEDIISKEDSRKSKK